MKRFILVIFEIFVGIIGNLIAGWIQQDIWENFFSPIRVLSSFISIILIVVILSIFDSDGDNFFSWYWHRFWYFYNLVHNSNLNHWSLDYAQLDISEVQRKRLTVDVVVAGERKNLLDVLSSSILGKGENAKRILVLGEPGSGKTTALERLILKISRQSLKTLGFKCKIPILARLGDFQNPELVNLLEQSLSREVQGNSGRILGTHINSLLNKGRVILLLDALDEALGETREEIIKGLRVFVSSQEFRHIPVIITARTHQDPRAGIPGFQVYEIQDLDDEAVNTFIDVYKDPLSITDFVRQDLEDIGVLDPKGIGRNPFWLRLIITSGIVEPIQSVLVDKAVDSLLEREWDKPETNRSWERAIPREEQLLVTKEALAFFAYSMNMSKELSSTRILAEKTLSPWLLHNSIDRKIKPRDIFGLGRDAQILIYRIDPIRFRHRIIQEFLAAYSMGLNNQIDTLKIIEDHIYDTDWWNTFQLFSGMAPNPRGLINSILGDSKDPIRLLLALILLFNINDSTYADIGERFLLEFQKCKFRDEKVKILTKMRDMVNDVTRIFLRLIEVDNEFVRQEAITVLGELGNPAAIKSLIFLLDDDKLSDSVGNALVQIGEPSIPYLIKSLTNKNEEICYKATMTLGKFGNLAVCPLIDYLSKAGVTISSHNTIITEKTFNLLWSEAEAAEEVEDKLLKGPYWAIRALGKTQSILVSDSLFIILRNSYGEIRQAASEALSNLPSDLVGPQLVAELLNPDEYIKLAVIRALGNIGFSIAFDSIAEILNDPNPLIRVEAINALAKIGDNKVVPLLIPLLQDIFTPVFDSAIKAINSLADNPFETLINAFNSSNTNTANQIAKAIVVSHLKQTKSYLKKEFRNPDARIRLRSTIFLRDMNPQDSLGFLVSLIKDKDNSIQIAALDILYNESKKCELHFPDFYGKYTSDMFDTLFDISIHADKRNRNKSIDVISKIGDDYVIETLINYFEKAEDSMRLKLFEALCWRNGEKIKILIRKSLSDKNDIISNLAIDTIGHIGDSEDIKNLQNIRLNSEYQREKISLSLRLIKDREFAHVRKKTNR